MHFRGFGFQQVTGADLNRLVQNVCKNVHEETKLSEANFLLTSIPTLLIQQK
jgi:hypothetical protein